MASRCLPAFSLALLILLPLASAATQEPEGNKEPDGAARTATQDEPVLKTRRAGDAAATVTVPEGTHLPLVLQNSVSTKTADVGDPLYFETTYPVVVNNRILIPVGSFVRGTITQVKRPGRVKGRGELHVRFDELTLPNGYTVDLTASLANTGANQREEVSREEGGVKADSSKAEDVGVIAGTAGAGAGVGAIAGRSGTSTAIGAAAGAAVGLATVLLTRGRDLELPRGTTVDITFDRPLELDAQLTQFDWTGQPSALPGPGAPPRTNVDPRYRPF